VRVRGSVTLAMRLPQYRCIHDDSAKPAGSSVIEAVRITQRPPVAFDDMTETR
jgi:hypothetical protein